MIACPNSSLVIRYILDGLELLDLSRAVRNRAKESFPLNIRTPDALHLSTALILGQQEDVDMLIFSHDQEMNRCALALGLGAPLA